VIKLAQASLADAEYMFDEPYCGVSNGSRNFGESRRDMAVDFAVPLFVPVYTFGRIDLAGFGVRLFRRARLALNILSQLRETNHVSIGCG
jgi:hypothetical protein